MDNIFNNLRNHLLQDEVPSYYLNKLLNVEEFKVYPFNLLYNLTEADQSPKYHPEGNVWNHTMLVVDQAAKIKFKSKNSEVFMWASLLHDIGKPSTTQVKNGRITSYNHDKVGSNLAKKFLNEFNQNDNLVDSVSALVRWHMQILFVVNNLPYANIKEMKKETDITEVALLGLCDRLGRGGVDRSKEQNNINIFLKKCERYK